jgi:hypothetical protein
VKTLLYRIDWYICEHEGGKKPNVGFGQAANFLQKSPNVGRCRMNHAYFEACMFLIPAIWNVHSEPTLHTHNTEGSICVRMMVKRW